MNVIRTFMLGATVAMLAGCAATEPPTGAPTVRCALLAPAALAAQEREAPCIATVGGPAASAGRVLQTAVWVDEAQVIR
jgi:hypothetical protein